MKHSYYNSRGQLIGEVDDVEKIYYTARNAKHGQIFLRKSVFNGVRKENAIAIDKEIIINLIKMNIKKIVVTIIGIEKMSYDITISPEMVISGGVEINYDRRKENINYTGYGSQIVISSKTDCIKINPLQKTLNS